MSTVRRWFDGLMVIPSMLILTLVLVSFFLISGFVYTVLMLLSHVLVDLEEKRRGKAAHHFVQGFAPTGLVVTLKTYKTGKYGRILAEVILDEANINQLLVSEGHATPYL